MILFHNHKQGQIAQASKEEAEKIGPGKIYTLIGAALPFYRAEFYHQKYYLQRLPGLTRELLNLYKSETDFVDATVIARLNGFMAGYGSAQTVKAELKHLDLPLKTREILQQILA